MVMHAVMRAEMQSVAERKAAYSADCAKPGTKEFENRYEGVRKQI